MFILEYEREFMQLNRHAKGMFPSEKGMCDQSKWRLRDELHALAAAS